MTHPDLTAETQLFQRETLYQYLAEIGGFLAELHHIDTALDYLADQRSAWGFPGPMGGLTGVGKVPVTFTLGTTAPFTRTYHVWGSPLDGFSWPLGSSRSDVITQRIQELAVEAQTWAANNMESLGSLIEEIVKPDAAMYQYRLVDTLTGVYDTLNEEVVDDFGKLEGQLHKWEGDAAESFGTNFYRPFKETLRHQRELLAELAGAAAAGKTIVQAAQHSLMNVVYHFREALREQLVLRSEDTSFSSNRTVRILGESTREAIGVLAPPYQLVEIAIGTVRDLATAADRGIPGAEDQTLAGRTADELLESVEQSIRVIKKHMGFLYDDLEAGVDEVLGKVERLQLAGEDGGYGALVPSEPQIVGGVDSCTFRHITGSA